MKTNFNEATQYQNSTSNQGDFQVKFFSINPGEQAIVRILVDSDDDLCAYGYHEIPTPDGKTKRVNCIRALRDDINKCPLCAANVKFDQQIYIHMLQYYPDGHIEAKTWGRKPPVGNKGTSVIDKIRKALNDYGPLSDYVSSITRTGTGLDTSYSININLPDKTYPPTSFPLDRSLFDGYSEEGTIIKNWTYDEMQNYLTTGTIPTSVSSTPSPTPFNTTAAQPAYQSVNNVPQAPVYNNQSVYQQPTTPAYQQPAYQPVPESVMNDVNVPFNGAAVPGDYSTLPFGNGMAPAQAYSAQPVMDRPVRRYN